MTLKIESQNDVLRVVIDQEEKRNALSRATLDEIRRTFIEHAENADLRFAILTGAGEKSFAAGGDLKDLMLVKGKAAAAAMARDAKTALAAIRSFPVPVIAALNGDALGGGAELAVACDMRIAAAHARIGFIQGRLAISSAWGGGVDLMRLVGPAKALQFLSRSEMLNAPQALASGLINDAAKEGETLEQALERFTEPMRRQAPHVMRAFKALGAHERGHGREAMDEIETTLFSQTWAHPDHDAATEHILKRME
jgi:enoyl-CoA hydratase